MPSDSKVIEDNIASGTFAVRPAKEPSTPDRGASPWLRKLRHRLDYLSRQMRQITRFNSNTNYMKASVQYTDYYGTTATDKCDLFVEHPAVMTKNIVERFGIPIDPETH